MKNPEPILKKLKLLSLSPEERGRIHGALAQYRAFAPARTGVRAPQRAAFSFGFPLPIIASFLVMAVVGTGTAAAAERAAPGDILYPVKIVVVEPAQLAAAVSPEAKARTEATFAERRLREAETLGARGTLSDETRAALGARFEAQTERTGAHLRRIAEKDPERAAAVAERLETALNMHEGALTELRGRADAPQGALMMEAKQDARDVRVDFGFRKRLQE